MRFCILAGFGSFYDPVHCYTNSTNCSLYVNQTVTFVCTCVHKNCSTSWELNGNSSDTKTVNGVDYTINVTDSIAGTMVCYNDYSPPDQYSWNVSVSQPSKYMLLFDLCKLLNHEPLSVAYKT